MISCSANAVDLGERVKVWLRDTAYPGDCKAKRIARDWGVSEGTAKLWLAGKRPEPCWIEAMANRWGRTFWLFVGQPVCGALGPATDEIRLADELTDLKARLARLERRDIDEHDRELVVAAPTGGLSVAGRPDDPSSGAVGARPQGVAPPATRRSAGR